MLALVLEACHNYLLHRLGLVGEHPLAIDGECDRGILSTDIDYVCFCEVNDGLRHFHVSVHGLQFLLLQIEFSIASLEVLAEELFLDQLVSVAIDHGKGKLVRLRITLRAADVEHRRHVDKLQIRQMALHGFESGVLGSFVVCHVRETALLGLLAFVVVLADANHRLNAVFVCHC